MTVKEIIRKYNLEDFEKTYDTPWGGLCNISGKELDEFFESQVKSININFPTNHVTITVLWEVK